MPTTILLEFLATNRSPEDHTDTTGDLIQAQITGDVSFLRMGAKQ